jgi:hypothetical protein
MINEELIAYIQSQARKNTPHDIIASRLAQAGWKQEDIDEAFKKIAPPPVVSTPTPQVILEKKPDLYREMPIVEKQSVEIVQPIKKEEPKVWVPMSATSVAPKVITPTLPPVDPIAPVVKQAPVVPTNLPGATHMPVHEELLPTLKPKVQEAPISPRPIPQSETIAIGLPKSAILSSYAQDVSSAVIITEDIDPRKKKRITRIVLIILLLIAGVLVFSYAKGYFTFSSFIKKDPREILVRAPVQFQDLESYKTHTEASISLPAFANITAGLTTGEVVTSRDKESISFITDGAIDHTHGNVSYDYSGIVKSSR